MADVRQSQHQEFDAASDIRPAWYGPAIRLSVAFVAVLMVMLFYARVYPLHHDLAGSLLSGRLAVDLGGAFSNYSLYFPPAEKVWFSSIVRISDATGLRLDLADAAASTLVILIGAELAYRIRRDTVGATPWFFFAPVAVLIVLPILYKNIFGLREPLIAAGLWPYLVLRVSDPDGSKIGWKMRAVVGGWVGATLLFKYLYAVVILLVELADAALQRRPKLLFRVENLIAGGIVVLYLFNWLALNSANRASLKAVSSSIEGALADPHTNLVMLARNFIYITAFLVLLRIFKVRARVVTLGAALVVGAVLAAWAQQRWFTHHLFLITLAYVAWWWMASRQFRWWGHVAVAMALFYPLLGEFLSTLQYREQVSELEIAIDDAGQSVAGKRVGILNMHPSPFNQYLVSNSAFRWIATPNIAYVPTELQPIDVPENEGKLAPPLSLENPGQRMLHDQIIRLWEDYPPDVIIFDESTRWPLRYLEVQWQRVYANDPRFSAVLSHYRPVFEHRGKRLHFIYYAREGNGNLRAKHTVGSIAQP